MKPAPWEKPTQAKVTQVAAWRTSDGELFAAVQEANTCANSIQQRMGTVFA